MIAQVDTAENFGPGTHDHVIAELRSEGEIVLHIDFSSTQSDPLEDRHILANDGCPNHCARSMGEEYTGADHAFW